MLIAIQSSRQQQMTSSNYHSILYLALFPRTCRSYDLRAGYKIAAVCALVLNGWTNYVDATCSTLISVLVTEGRIYEQLDEEISLDTTAYLY